MGNSVSPKHRRGKILEDAILSNAWEELNQLGYIRLTMEGIAARAKTSKAALYRRWPSKALLVSAAIRECGPPFPQNIPNLGSLREDMIFLLKNLTNYFYVIGAETIHGLITDNISRILDGTFGNGTEEGAAIITQILEQAKKRGEISQSKYSPRILYLPFAMLQHEMITKPVSTEDFAIELVDQIFLPIIFAHNRKKVAHTQMHDI